MITDGLAARAVSAGLVALLVAAFSSTLAQQYQETPEFVQMRRFLAEAIEKGVNIARLLRGEPAIDLRVIAAMAKVPRHEFVPTELREYAYTGSRNRSSLRSILAQWHRNRLPARPTSSPTGCRSIIEDSYLRRGCAGNSCVLGRLPLSRDSLRGRRSLLVE